MCEQSPVCRVRNIVGEQMFDEMLEALESAFQAEASKMLELTLLSTLRTLGLNELTLDAATSTDVLQDKMLDNIRLNMVNNADGSLYMQAERLANNENGDSLQALLKMLGLE